MKFWVVLVPVKEKGKLVVSGSERGLVDLEISWDVGRVRKRNWWLGVRIVDMSGSVTVVLCGRGWSTVPWNHRVVFVVWVVFFVV